MAKRMVDKRVDEALRVLTQGKEASVRALATDLSTVETIETKLAALTTERDNALTKAQESFEAAKAAGWSTKELRAAGLVPPRAPKKTSTTDRDDTGSRDAGTGVEHGDDESTGQTQATTDDATSS